MIEIAVLLLEKKIKTMFVDNTIRVPRPIEDIIQEIGYASSSHRQEVGLQIAVENLEKHLPTIPFMSRPQAPYSTQIITDLLLIFKRDEQRQKQHVGFLQDELHLHPQPINREEERLHNHTVKFTKIQRLVERIEFVKNTIEKMYLDENKLFKVLDFKKVECVTVKIGKMGRGWLEIYFLFMRFWIERFLRFVRERVVECYWSE